MGQSPPTRRGSSEDGQYLRRAIDLACDRRTHPNPTVGAVVVDSAGQVVGEGHHDGPGTDHAEVKALRVAGDSARGGTIYVSLEPCSHHGRTPPCVDAIVAAGIRRLVYAVDDPDTRVSGSGARKLEERGVIVEGNIDPAGGEAVDPSYFHHRRTGLPRVRLKFAMTIDGSVAAADGSSRWITGEAARADAHEVRSRVDAVVVGAGTLRSDDPLLSVRTPRFEGPQPAAVVVAGRSPMPWDAAIWQRDPIVVSTAPREIPGGRLLIVSGDDAFPDPGETARALAAEGHLDILLEGGPRLASTWWKADVISGGLVYLAGKMGGGTGVSPLAGMFASIEDATEVAITAVRELGMDLRIDFERI